MDEEEIGTEPEDADVAGAGSTAPGPGDTEPREAGTETVDAGTDGEAAETGAADGEAVEAEAADGEAVEAGAQGAEAGLSARDRAVLALERAGLPGPGAKERAVRERLGMSPTRYYQLLNALLDDPRALEHDPVTVNRLRRVRDARRAAR
ncbi:DUF3263 domain-containing protein [Streptomyces sp. NPDC007088]|uniref:DUF3263 domain-containing protein n=1 Tax=Streptomyces sp. NPDC007088 TaxID=3364773 RepID=UPI0036B1A688